MTDHETAAVVARVRAYLAIQSGSPELQIVADLRHLLRCAEAWEFVRENVCDVVCGDDDEGHLWAVESWKQRTVAWPMGRTPLAAVLSALDAKEAR